MTVKTLSYISSFSVFFPLVICILRRKYIKEELQIVFLYIIASLTIEIFASIWAHILHRPNHYMINIFAVTECVLISLMYRKVFIGKVLKAFSLIAISIFVLIAIAIFTEILSIQKFNSTVNTISCILIIIWVFIYFYQLLQTLESIKLSTLPLFWISVACLLYFSGTLFLFLYGETILFQKDAILFKQLWIIYDILLVVFRILLAIGLWFSKTAFQLSKSFSN